MIIYTKVQNLSMKSNNIIKKLEYISEEESISETHSKIYSEINESSMSENTKWMKYGINKVKKLRNYKPMKWPSLRIRFKFRSICGEIVTWGD